MEDEYFMSHYVMISWFCVAFAFDAEIIYLANDFRVSLLLSSLLLLLCGLC